MDPLSFRKWLVDLARPMKTEQKNARSKLLVWFIDNPDLAPTHPLAVASRGHARTDAAEIRKFLVRAFPEWKTAWGLAAGPYALIDNYRVWRNNREKIDGTHISPAPDHYR